MPDKYILRLFVAGTTPDNQAKIVEFKEQLNKLLEDSYSLEVIDVLERPNLAEEERILATPTVVRRSPAPIKRIILNFNHLISKADLNMIKSDQTSDKCEMDKAEDKL